MMRQVHIFQKGRQVTYDHPIGGVRASPLSIADTGDSASVSAATGHTNRLIAALVRAGGAAHSGATAGWGAGGPGRTVTAALSQAIAAAASSDTAAAPRARRV